MNKAFRMQVARETVEAMEKGFYLSTHQQPVSIAEGMQAAINGTRTYSSADLDSLLTDFDPTLLSESCKITVVAQSSFVAGKEAVQAHGKVLCLNFASAKNPGGGFLSGAQAQEEALTRSSALFDCLKDQNAYYHTNRACGTTLYTDTMIHSPAVPFFKDDEGLPLDNWFPLSILTAPAVNEGAVRQNEPNQIPKIRETMLRRTEKLLTLAAYLEYRHLILGAWGCGVFRNDPEAVADYFYTFLGPQGRFAHCFETVTFAILGSKVTSPNLAAFQQRFA